MTVCNMTIEAGARAGLIAVDDKTIEYVKNKNFPLQMNSLILLLNIGKLLKLMKMPLTIKLFLLLEMT